MRTVLFKASSTFINFTAMVMEELYFSECHRILVLSHEIYQGYKEEVVSLGFFDEVHVIYEGDKSLNAVEHTLDNLFDQLPTIDDYFMNTFSDCYSIAIAYKLMGKAKLHLYPEGGSCIRIDKVLEWLMTKSDTYSKDPVRKVFFEKYPLDLSIFDYSWVYDSNTPQGELDDRKRVIEIRELENKNNYGEILKRLNALFKYSSVDDIEVCLLDTFEPQDDAIEYSIEKEILDVLFRKIRHYGFYVKPRYPGARMLPYAKFKYGEYGVKVLDAADVPWELIFLNILASKSRELTIITLQLEGTYIMTSLAMVPTDFQLNIVTLNKIEFPYYNKYFKASYDLNYEYFSQAIKKENVKTIMPEDINALAKIDLFSGEISNSSSLNDIKLPPESRYFSRMGNLVTESVLFDEDITFIAKSYINFIEDSISVCFEIDRTVESNKLIWKPSANGIFTRIENIKAVLYDSNGIEHEYSLGDKDIQDGEIRFETAHSGLCKKLVITGNAFIYKKVCNLYDEFYILKWQEAFWRKMYVLKDKLESLKKSKFVESNEMVWIYGWTDMGIKLGNLLKDIGVQVVYVSTYGNEGYYDGRSDITIAQASELYGFPNRIVVIPLRSYEVIMTSLKNEYKNVALKVETFLNMMMSYVNS